MADIDYFKAYNDNYGHLKGDESLIKVANTMVSSVKRPLDLVTRYGGEEFAVILSETDIKGATIVAEKIRKNIEELDLTHEYSGVAPCITLSLGITTIIANRAYSMEDFINSADKALYSAKSNGRNTIFSCDK